MKLVKNQKQADQIRFVDLVQRYEDEKQEILECVDRVLSKGHLIMTEEVTSLEKQIEQFCGVGNCVSLNSGTDALMMGLWAAGIGKGDEVIVPNISFIASIGAIVHVGAVPVICDVRLDFLIDVSQIETLITDKTKAIMPVHWTGRTCDMETISDIAQKYGLLVIEDAAQSMGSYVNGKHSGTTGLVGAISCHPLKNLNALGDGGLLITNDDEIAQKVKLYKNHGLRARDDVEIFGVNSRLDALSAEVLRFRLKKLPEVNRKRNANAERYMQNLRDVGQVQFVENRESEIEARVMFLGLFDDRDNLQKTLKQNGVESLIYYGTPLSEQQASKAKNLNCRDFPVSERICQKVLALPHHQYITTEQVDYVSDIVRSFYR